VTDPRRLSDEADHELALLLRAGQRELPPGRALEKTIAGLGAATTVIGASHAALAAVSVAKLGMWTLAKWAGVGMLGGVATIGGLELVQLEVAPPAAPVATATLPRVHSRSTPPSPAPAAAFAAAAPPAGEPAPARVATPSVSRATTAPVQRPPTPPAAESAADSAISVEIGWIDQARRALRAGDAPAALAALNRYHAEVKRPRLAPEAQYLEMEALRAAGHDGAARQAAARLLASAPRGPHAARARAILEAP
jgi:hypothetical protein